MQYLSSLHFCSLQKPPSSINISKAVKNHHVQRPPPGLAAPQEVLDVAALHPHLAATAWAGSGSQLAPTSWVSKIARYQNIFLEKTKWTKKVLILIWLVSFSGPIFDAFSAFSKAHWKAGSRAETQKATVTGDNAIQLWVISEHSHLDLWVLRSLQSLIASRNDQQVTTAYMRYLTISNHVLIILRYSKFFWPCLWIGCQIQWVLAIRDVALHVLVLPGLHQDQEAQDASSTAF